MATPLAQLAPVRQRAVSASVFKNPVLVTQMKAVEEDIAKQRQAVACRSSGLPMIARAARSLQVPSGAVWAEPSPPLIWTLRPRPQRAASDRPTPKISNLDALDRMRTAKIRFSAEFLKHPDSERRSEGPSERVRATKPSVAQRSITGCLLACSTRRRFHWLSRQRV